MVAVIEVKLAWVEDAEIKLKNIYGPCAKLVVPGASIRLYTVVKIIRRDSPENEFGLEPIFEDFNLNLPDMCLQTLHWIPR